MRRKLKAEQNRRTIERMHIRWLLDDLSTFGKNEVACLTADRVRAIMSAQDQHEGLNPFAYLTSVFEFRGDLLKLESQRIKVGENDNAP